MSRLLAIRLWPRFDACCTPANPMLDYDHAPVCLDVGPTLFRCTELGRYASRLPVNPSPELASNLDLTHQAVFDHAAHAVPDARTAAIIYRDVLGGEFLYGGENTRVGFRGVVFGFRNGGKVEIIAPLPGSTFLDGFFKRSNIGGLHHLTFRVPHLRQTIADAEEAGHKVFGIYEDDPNWKEAFIHPREASGALLQFVQAPEGHPRRDPSHLLEQLLG